MNLNDFVSNVNFLPWLIPVGPLLAFFVITLLMNLIANRVLARFREVYE